MTRIAPRSTSLAARLLGSGSFAALALAAGFAPASANAQNFGTMVGMQAGRTIGPNGQVSVWQGANRPTIGTDSSGRPLMTIEQTQQKALLDWEDFRLQTDEILEFKQQASNWIAVNRVHGGRAAEVNGEIRAIGQVYIFNDNGVLIGKDAKINTRTLVTGRGFSDVNVSGNTTTLVQSKERGLLDWSNMDVKTGEVLKFQQEKSSWIALNRSYNAEATRIDGTVEANGNLYLVAPRGISVDGTINAQQVVLSSLFMRDDQFLPSAVCVGGLTSCARDYNGRTDPTFSNSWWYPNEDSGYNPWGTKSWVGQNNYYELMDPGPSVVDPNDPLKYNVTVGRSGVVNTGKFGKVMLFGPRVTNKGTLNIRDEGQVILAAGDNIYLALPAYGQAANGMLDVFVGAYNPLNMLRSNIPYYYGAPPQTVNHERLATFYSLLLGRTVVNGETLNSSEYSKLTQGFFDNGVYTYGGLIGQYLNQAQAKRAREVGYVARNEGIISSERGGRVDFRGLSLEQMGAVDITSTALFRGAISFRAVAYDWREYANADGDGSSIAVPGHGTVTFGKGSLTQITPDLDSTDRIPVSSGAQSVGTLSINASGVNMQKDALIYMPSGLMTALLDAGQFVLGGNRGAGMNQGNEDGTRFFMDTGATIDLSGWKTTLAMGYHQVSGRLFAAQLSDSPMQRDGPLYRKEISVDRRFGTNIGNWQSFDNLSEGTLAQFLTNGGSLTMDIGDDFIMKSGSVIDVSGGVTTYTDGYVYTTLLRRLDGSVIDIREADPDELYMGLANEWVVYDTKWGHQRTYYIPLVSSVQGKFESSYQHGGKGGKIEILAPDAVLQGTLKGQTVAGRYQRANAPAGGAFILNDAGESESEYVSNNMLITAAEKALRAEFGFYDKLSDSYGDLFGEEFDRDKGKPNTDTRHSDNATLASADFFNRSTMGSYQLAQSGRVGEKTANNTFVPLDGAAVLVEQGADIRLSHGGSLTIEAGQRVEFLGNFRSEGGNFSLMGMGVKLGETSRIDTRGSWYSDFEIDEPIALGSVPRIHGGNISIAAFGTISEADDVGLVLPDKVVLDSSGGAWVNRNGVLTGGKGGNLAITAYSQSAKDVLNLDALDHARAYGLGGNGSFKLSTSRAIVVGDALPQVDGEPVDPNSQWLIRPDFFTKSGFSAINFETPLLTVTKGTQVQASSQLLQLRDQTLYNGRPPAYWTASGTDIYDVAEIVDIPLAMRPAALRRGMDLSVLGSADVQQGALLGTGIRGNITINGNATIAGTLLAPAGKITVAAGTDTGGTVIHVTETGRLLAPAASIITERLVDALGRERLGGELYDGGAISLTAFTVNLDKGAVLDVSGGSATFDLAVDDGHGGVLRQPVALASNGGSVSLFGSSMDIDNATYLASAGGAGARGGGFSLNWAAKFGGPDLGGQNPTQVIDQLEQYFSWGLVTDGQGSPITNPYGVDLSTLDFTSLFGYNPDFAPGTVLNSRDDVLGRVNGYAVAAKGLPPMLIIGSAAGMDLTAPELPVLNPGLVTLLDLFGYTLPKPTAGKPAITVLSPEKIAGSGFSSLRIDASPGAIFSGNVNFGGKKADGRYVFDTIAINADRIMAREGATVQLEAGIVSLGASLGNGGGNGYFDALTGFGVRADNANARFTATGGTLLEVGSADFLGFADVALRSGGDIRLAGYVQNGSPTNSPPPTGLLHTTGTLTLKADQVYAGTGRIFTISSDKSIEIQAQDDGGPINGSPYEAAAQLTLKAPTIIQGGTLRSPLGTLNLEVYDNGTEGSGVLLLKPGSLTSVSAEGRVIPYGFTSNGDSWINPYTGLELTTLPSKTVNIKGDVVDIAQGAVIDVSGGGDLFAREFVPGVGGTTDWLTGYRDADYTWVSAPGEVYAVMPDYQGNIAPLGFGNTALGVGDRVYLSGGSGLKAGSYVLLPAEYALMPGAYRVTVNRRGGDFTDVRLGQIANLTDGSTIQAGYRMDGASGARDQRNLGFHVMPGKALRMRSSYIETRANSFFTSDAFLRKALRINRPISEVPRTPLDGGSVVFSVSKTLDLNGALKSAPGEKGRGGFADIASAKVVIAGAGTDRSQYDGYLILDSAQLSSFGAESLLIGGTRRQGEVNLELNVAGTDIVIDNQGSVLFGPELLFASSGTIDVKNGAQLETRGTLSGTASDLRIIPATPTLIDDNGTDWTTADDIVVHAALDRGALLRVSSGGQIDILRNGDAVEAMRALRENPTELARINDLRASKGLAAIDPFGGTLNVAGGASIKSSRSVTLDATLDTLLAAGATLQAKELSASASRISIGDVPTGTGGLVFAGGALGVLGNASELTLKSYSSIDLHGAVTLSASEGLRLDTRELRVIGSGEAKIGAKALTLANTLGGTVPAAAGGATLTLDATNLYVEGGNKWLSGVSAVNINARERIIGRDDGTLFVPGQLNIATANLTTDSSARLFLDAAGAIAVTYNGNTNLPVFRSFGGTLGLVGASIDYAGQTRITGGTINLQARSGDVVVRQGAVLDVTSNVSRFYDQSVGVGAGSVNLIADLGDVVAQAGSTIDVSGTAAGGNAGTLTVQTGAGAARLEGTLLGTATAGFASGSFSLVTQSMADFAGFNARLDAGGFRHSRRFEINQGDITLDGSLSVQNLAIVANSGAITVTGAVTTTGANGGRIQLSAARDVTLASGAKLVARALAADGSGGNVLLETSGVGGGAINTAAGSLIDVSGVGEGGRTVRFRAPQTGSDIGIGQLAGTVTGARTVMAEGYRVYDGITVIDQTVIDRVQGDAQNFMDANAAAIRAQLGTNVSLTAGIELRSEGDMELKTDWDLSGVRFDGAPGVLTLRAVGDLKINANLSDGFAGGALLSGNSWSFNLAGGANVVSPDSMAVLPRGLLEGSRGSVLIGGTPDTIEYYYDPAYGNENRLYLLDDTGRFVRDLSGTSLSGFVELTRDADGKYINPLTGTAIEKDPSTGDYVDTQSYARRPLPWMALTNFRADGTLGDTDHNGIGQSGADLRDYMQWNNATGYVVRTGTGDINLASGRDLVLQERASVLYTAGRDAGALAGFHAPDGAQYGVAGGDLRLVVSGDILANRLSPQMPNGYMQQDMGLDPVTGLFASGRGRDFRQTSWWVDYTRFQAGIGALGGGNIDISAGGNIDNLSVAIPNSGRVTGNDGFDANGRSNPMALTLTGGGNLSLRAGGNLLGGTYYLGSGTGDLSVGGSVLSGSTVQATPYVPCDNGNCYLHEDFRRTAATFDLYTMFFTSSGKFDVRSGGDLNIDGVMDPLIGYNIYSEGITNFVSMTERASVRLFSAGGDVTLWNNGANVSIAYLSSGSTAFNRAGAPLALYGSPGRPFAGMDSIGWDLYPSTVQLVAATGNVRVLGGMTMLPAARGQLDLLAGGGVYIGYGTQAVDPFLPNTTLGAEAHNYRGFYEGLYMSQAKMDFIRTPTNNRLTIGQMIGRGQFRFGGGGSAYPSNSYFTFDHVPDLHMGDTQPVRVYAAGGDVVLSSLAMIYSPKPLWVQAEGNVYFPSYEVQHNNPNDLSLVRSGKGIYFNTYFGEGWSNDPNVRRYGHITISGPGRLEVEAGTDIWLPSNEAGITSQRVQVYTFPGSSNLQPSGLQDLDPDQKAADIAISAGYNQKPSYAAFEDAYLNPGKAGGMADYLRDESTGLSLYLFDREYARAEGATGEFATPEAREGLVNYVRRLQGLDALKTKAEQAAYLDMAWSYWQSLSSDYKTPYYRSVLFLELRTTGREANDPKSDRYNTSARGYKAIETLFPGAQKDADTALVDGESRWKGDFETFASRVVSTGGGKVEFVLPGGGMTLANVAAKPAETGQPAFEGDRGNAMRAGILTTDGGEINILGHNSIDVNESRVLTTKGGNVLIWSSWGDIAAGKGAKTAISPQFYNYGIDSYGRMERVPAGLPTGAGIGTLKTQDGAPPADVDLIAPAGIVDAGDAGIRVSGNFNVFALEILGTDNIDVAGVVTGLPVPPAAPPTALDVGEVGAKSAAVDQALEQAVAQARRSAAIIAPSIIEVRVTGYGDDSGTGGGAPRGAAVAPPAITPGQIAPTQVAMRSEDRARSIAFDMKPQPIDDAVRAIGRTSGLNILYDAAILKAQTAPALRGSMTPEQALERLLSGQGLVPVRIGPRTIMLRRSSI